MVTITKHTNWQSAYDAQRPGQNDALIIRHDDGREVRYEFDSDANHFYVYARRWTISADGSRTDQGYDPVRAFRRHGATRPNG